MFDSFLTFRENADADINKLEIALDQANSKAQKAIKHYQNRRREADCKEEEKRQRQEVAERAIKHYQGKMKECEFTCEEEKRQRQEVAEGVFL